MPSSRADEHQQTPDQPRAEMSEQSLPDSPTRAPEGDGRPSGAPPQTSELEAQVARLEDRYKRALADLDNYRKRAERETQRRVADARERLLRDWLEAVDSVERALRVQPDDQGLRAVLEQMQAILARNGVSRLGAVGDAFDPERHEAIGVQPSDEAADRSILEVARSGFALGDDRVLRPAQVVVARRTEG